MTGEEEKKLHQKLYDTCQIIWFLLLLMIFLNYIIYRENRLLLKSDERKEYNMKPSAQFLLWNAADQGLQTL